MLEGIIPRNFPKPERGYTLRSRALALAPLPMALVCFLLLGIQADFASGWTERTQHSLPIFAPWKLADDPSHPGRVYAVGTEYPGMGYWTVSDDEGMTWAAPRFIDSHPPVGAPLRMSVLPDGVILVAYISGARSDDEGATWTSISPPRPTLPVPDLPAGTVVTLAPTAIFVPNPYPFVFVSDDEGLTYTQVALPVEPEGTATELTPGADQLTWADNKHLVLRRADGEASWINFNGPPGSLVTLTISPQDLRVWYAVSIPNDLSGPTDGLWRTTDGGENWTWVLHGPSGLNKIKYVSLDARDPDGNALIIGHLSTVGDETIEWSPDRGETWVPLGSPPVLAPSTFEFRDLHQLGDRLLVSADNGIWETDLPPMNP